MTSTSTFLESQTRYSSEAMAQAVEQLLGGNPITTSNNDEVETTGKGSVPRRRRKRTAIELPAEAESQMDEREVKRVKNRIAAARARERTQQRVQDLESMVRKLWGRVQYLETQLGYSDNTRDDQSSKEWEMPSIKHLVASLEGLVDPPRSPVTSNGGESPVPHESGNPLWTTDDDDYSSPQVLAAYEKLEAQETSLDMSQLAMMFPSAS